MVALCGLCPSVRLRITPSPSPAGSHPSLLLFPFNLLAMFLPESFSPVITPARGLPQPGGPPDPALSGPLLPSLRDVWVPDRVQRLGWCSPGFSDHPAHAHICMRTHMHTCAHTHIHMNRVVHFPVNIIYKNYRYVQRDVQRNTSKLIWLQKPSSNPTLATY